MARARAYSEEELGLGLVRLGLVARARAYSEEESDGEVKEPNQRHKEKEGKYGAHNAAHPDLLLVADEGRGYDVGQEQQVDQEVEDQVGEGVAMLPQKVLPLEVGGSVEELYHTGRECLINHVPPQH